MLLKDCPVGSVVRLKTLGGFEVGLKNWLGEFKVKSDGLGKYVIDKDGEKRYSLEENDEFQFEIITELKSDTPKKIYFKGEYYNLIPTSSSSFIEIDGVEYYMEPA